MKKLLSLLFALVLALTAASVSAQESQTYYVVTQRARVREAPSTGSAVVMTLNRGTAVKVLGTAEGTSVNGSILWYLIEVDGQTGYVHSSLLAADEPSVIVDRRLYFTRQPAIMRAEPITTSDVVIRLPQGTPLFILDEVEGADTRGSSLWYRIQAEGKTGYVHSSLITNKPPNDASSPPVNTGTSGLRIRVGTWSFTHETPPIAATGCLWIPNENTPWWSSSRFTIAVVNGGQTVTATGEKLCTNLELNLVSDNADGITYSGTGTATHLEGGSCTMTWTFTSPTTATGIFNVGGGCNWTFRINGVHG